MSSRKNRPAMGIATEQSHKNKLAYLQFLETTERLDEAIVAEAVTGFFDRSAKINGSHPINEAEDGLGYATGILRPISEAFAGCIRQNYIVLAGEYLGTEWVTSTGYFYGHFHQPLVGIPPSGKMAMLRFGEFHRMEGGKIVETHVYLGFAELIIALGLWPLALSEGYEGVVPGPATHDGIQTEPADATRSRATADLVEGMLKELATEDEAWRPYWDDRMVWYGPGALGSYATIEGFAEFQRPFELVFDGWGDGKEAGITGVGSNCKSGDGEYAFLHGWRQITGIHVRPFLGLEPTHKRVFMRDCDWWRCENGKIIENWCMLDIPHLLHQLGYDLFAEINKQDR